MAMGDDARARNAVQYRGDMAQDTLSNLRDQQVNPTFQNLYNQNQLATDRQMTDYGDIMQQFKSFTGQPLTNVAAQNVNYNRTPEMNESFQNYRNFAQTGGFSGQDIADMRARGVSPIRSVYENAQNEMKRQRALQGGYSPNFTAASAKMSRNLGQQIADNVQNVNADLAEKIQRGKMFGAGGFGDLSTNDMKMMQEAALANQSAGLRAGEINRNQNDQRLAAIEGQARLFGTGPGLMGTIGNQMLQGLGEAGRTQGMQNQLGIEIPRNTISAGQMPGTFDQWLGRIGNISDIASDWMVPGKGLIPSGRAGGAGNINSGMYNSPGNVYQNSPYSY